LNQLVDPDGFLEPEPSFHFEPANRANWWFHSVVKRELLACLTWEIAREDPCVRCYGHGDGLSLAEAPIWERQRLYPLICKQCGFPDRPWSNLPKNDRKYLVETLKTPWAFSYRGWADAQAVINPEGDMLAEKSPNPDATAWQDDTVVILVPYRAIEHASREQVNRAVEEALWSRLDARKRRNLNSRHRALSEWAALEKLSCLRLAHVYGIARAKGIIRDNIEAHQAPQISMNDDFWRRCGKTLREVAGRLFPYRDRSVRLLSETPARPIA